ncbi:MAG: hypothetical protein WC880_04435 [Candidatus Paceibacterota bacterium]
MLTHLAEEAPREIANQKGNRRKSESALQRERARAAKDSAYAPVKVTRAIYHDVFVKAKSDTDPAVVIARQKYRAAFQAYKQFVFQTEGLDAAERAVGAESWKARPYLSIAGKHITPEQMSATVAVGSIAVPAVAAAPLAAAFHLGGTSLYAMVAAGAGFGVVSHFAIKPVAKGIREEYASKELAARQAGQTIEDFKKENRELLRDRAKSIGRRRLARLAASLGFTTATVITTGVLTPDHVGHSAGQWASKGVDAGLHHIGLEQGWADYLAHGTGAFQGFMQKFGAAAGFTLQELFGIKTAAAAEMHAPGSQGVVRAGYVPTGTGSAVIETATGGAPEVGRTQLITHFGSAPWARSLTEALSPRSISEAADVLIRGGMNPEAREEFIAAASAFKNNQSPEFVDFTRREWEAQAFRTRGVPSVLGDGVDRVLFDASREPGFRGEHPPVYRALKMPFSYTDARGVLHEVMVEIPIGKADGSGEQDCYNFSLYSDRTVVTPPPTPETFVPPPTPEQPVLVAARIIWSEQSGFVAQDCTDCGGSEMKVTNLRILEYRGESLEEARQYMRAAISERSAWEGYQQVMTNKFTYLKFYNTLTQTYTYHCFSLGTETFSQPTIVTDRGTEFVRTAEQFDGLVTGTSEELRMIGTMRGSDISVMSPKDPMPLVAIDPDGDGRPNRFVPGMDINGNGILEANEIGRTLNDIVNNQIYLIGNDIVPQETGNPNAQATLERAFLSKIPEGFIQGRTEGARFSALKAEFGGILSDEQIRELGGYLHFYAELHKTPAHPDGAAAFRNPDGSPKVIFQFLREGITETARPQNGSVGDFPDLRRAQ